MFMAGPGHSQGPGTLKKLQKMMLSGISISNNTVLSTRLIDYLIRLEDPAVIDGRQRQEYKASHPIKSSHKNKETSTPKF